MASDDGARIAHYQARLEELKAKAEIVKDVQTRELLLGIAGDYEKLATMAKKRLARGDSQ